MIAVSDRTLFLIAVLAVFLVISAFRMAGYAKRYGYNHRLFFFLTLFFTPIPATLFFWGIYIKQRMDRREDGTRELPGLRMRMKHRPNNCQAEENEES